MLWAGKLDYWLIGGSTSIGWPALCRFDGDSQAWQPLRVPTATTLRTTPLVGPANAVPGAIRAGACLAWDSCWFFGSYGTILRWNGATLSDVSPDSARVVDVFSSTAESRRPLLTGFTAAAATRDPLGRPRGIAAGSSSGFPTSSRERRGMLAARPGGLPPPQLWTLTGPQWEGSAWTPSTEGTSTDPFHTDLVAASLDSSGRAWVAGNPALRGASSDRPRLRIGPSPVLAVRGDQADAGCPGPPADRFGRGASDPSRDAFAWQTIAAFPGAERVVVGGAVHPVPPTNPTRNRDGEPEPVIAGADCAGTTTITTFSKPDPESPNSTIPANRTASIQATAAPAANRAWASTGFGALRTPGGIELEFQPPRLYTYTDGQPATAPAGDDNEPRPIPIQEDPPIIVFEPPLPAEPPPPQQVQKSRTRTVPPAIFAITSKVTNNTLVVTFKVRRPAMIGVVAERNGVVVATTGLRKFAKGSGRLTLRLDPRRWPTKITFINDAPKVELTIPKGTLTRTVSLRASASAIKGRRITSVAFEYSPAGRDDWTQIDLDRRAPFVVRFDTRTVKNGRYRLRAIAIDSAKQSALSDAQPVVTVRNGSAG